MACSYVDLVCTAEELYMLTEDTGLKLEQLAGMVMNPLTGNWTLSTSTEVNYIAHFVKTSLAVRLREEKAHAVVNSKAADLAVCRNRQCRSPISQHLTGAYLQSFALHHQRLVLLFYFLLCRLQE